VYIPLHPSHCARRPVAAHAVDAAAKMGMVDCKCSAEEEYEVETPDQPVAPTSGLMFAGDAFLAGCNSARPQRCIKGITELEFVERDPSDMLNQEGRRLGGHEDLESLQLYEYTYQLDQLVGNQQFDHPDFEDDDDASTERRRHPPAASKTWVDPEILEQQLRFALQKFISTHGSLLDNDAQKSDIVVAGGLNPEDSEYALRCTLSTAERQAMRSPTVGLALEQLVRLEKQRTEQPPQENGVQSEQPQQKKEAAAPQRVSDLRSPSMSAEAASLSIEEKCSAGQRREESTAVTEDFLGDQSRPDNEQHCQSSHEDVLSA